MRAIWLRDSPLYSLNAHTITYFFSSTWVISYIILSGAIEKFSRELSSFPQL